MTQKYRHILHVIALHFGVDFGYDTIKYKKVHSKIPVNHKQIVFHYCHCCQEQGWRREFCLAIGKTKQDEGLLGNVGDILPGSIREGCWSLETSLPVWILNSLLVFIMSLAAAIGEILLPRFLKLQIRTETAKLYQQTSRLIKTLHFK